jgi:hypothetical protein
MDVSKSSKLTVLATRTERLLIVIDSSLIYSSPYHLPIFNSEKTSLLPTHRSELWVFALDPLSILFFNHFLPPLPGGPFYSYFFSATISSRLVYAMMHYDTFLFAHSPLALCLHALRYSWF